MTSSCWPADWRKLPYGEDHALANFRAGSSRLYRYNEAIVLFKSPQEALWHAAALEGLATIPVVESWSSTHAIVGVINC